MKKILKVFRIALLTPLPIKYHDSTRQWTQSTTKNDAEEISADEDPALNARCTKMVIIYGENTA